MNDLRVGASGQVEFIAPKDKKVPAKAGSNTGAPVAATPSPDVSGPPQPLMLGHVRGLPLAGALADSNIFYLEQTEATEHARSVDFATLRSAIISDIAKASGLTVTASAFKVDGFAFDGGSIDVLQNGTWYVGVDLFRKVLIALPRLGHRGWIPVARVIATSVVQTVEQIAPALPTSRIPRTLAKIMRGENINVRVIGSSLTAGGNPTDWSGMLFRSDASVTAYKVPSVANFQNAGVGGSPNQYQLVQAGFASSHSAYGFGASGTPNVARGKLPPNGRSQLFSGVDLVVLGCLANGGDYRLESIEPIIRKLREQGCEIIVVADNWQGPTSKVADLATGGLYQDGPFLQNICDLYGVEFADTAAYVAEAQFRYGASAIYDDTIHMKGALPAGRNAPPSCGHEVWARAVRSVITIDGAPPPPQVMFASQLPGVAAYNGQSATPTRAGEKIRTVATGAAPYGIYMTLGIPLLAAGDTVLVECDIPGADIYQVGMQAGGWASNIAFAAPGHNSLLLTATGPTADLIFYGGTTGVDIVVDNLKLTISRVGSIVAQDVTPGRAQDARPLPPLRIVTDYRTPADAFVIMPKDEIYLAQSRPGMGTLGPHPWGVGSFARKWGNSGANEDLLTLTVGQKAVVSAACAVGYGFIRYADENDASATIEIRCNTGLMKTMTLGTVPFGNEWFTSIFTPTELNADHTIGPSGDINGSYEIIVTAGTVKIAALYALTADVSFVAPEEATYVGNWLPRETGRSGMPGVPTDTAGAYAFLRCPGRRLQWIVGGYPNSQIVDVWSDRERNASFSTQGNYNEVLTPALLGPGALYYIKNTFDVTGEAGNRALMIGGAVIINDR